MTDLTDLLVLASPIDDAETLGTRLDKLLKFTVMSLMVTVSVILEWRRSKSVISAGAAALGGFALWYVVINGVVFRDSVGEDLTPGGPAAPGKADKALERVAVPGSGQVVVLAGERR